MIDANVRYHLVYAAIAFSRNEPFLRRLASLHPVEIPYIELSFLSAEQREPLDTYIYVKEDEAFPTVFRKLKRQYPQLQLTDLGTLSGVAILKLVASCEVSAQRKLDIKGFYKVLFGPYRNLHVTLERIEGDDAFVSFQILDEPRELRVPVSALESTPATFNPNAGFRNLMTNAQKRGQLGAVILDGSFELHRSMYGYPKMFTKDKRFVGGCNGFYFRLLYLKQLYPEREIHVVFDGYNAAKFENNPEYKATRVKFTEAWRQHYIDNLDWCKRLTQAAGFHLHVPPAEEGDDMVGSIAHHLAYNKGYQDIHIYSRDTDFYQLVDDRISLLLPKETFRGHSQEIKPPEAIAHFGVNEVRKINWCRAMAGDESDNIRGVNKFYYTKTGVLTRYQKQHYLPLINNAETLEEARAAILADLRFCDFVEDGAFDRNLNLLEIKRDLISPDDDLKGQAHTFDEKVFSSLLEEVAFFKELEAISRISRIIQGVW